MALAVAAPQAGPHGTVVPVHVTTAASNWLGASSYEPVVEQAYRAAHERLAEIKDIDTGLAHVEPELIEGELGRSAAARRPQPGRARNRPSAHADSDVSGQSSAASPTRCSSEPTALS